MTDLREQIRDLHQPDPDGGYRCLGCDHGTDDVYDEVPWPCNTANLVYTVEEIDEYYEAYLLWRKWVNARNYRARMASGWGMADEISRIYRSEIAFQLQAPITFNLINDIKGTA